MIIGSTPVLLLFYFCFYLCFARPSHKSIADVKHNNATAGITPSVYPADKPIPFIALKRFIQQFGVFSTSSKYRFAASIKSLRKLPAFRIKVIIMAYGKVPLRFIESQFIHFVFDRKLMNQAIAQTIENALGIVSTPRQKILVDEADIGLPDHSHLPGYRPTRIPRDSRCCRT
ncbi:MAG: hypothetical protein MZV70_15255 [Desulfobacterales bacterium]|nr:hypothetical protein [Desulfobacterales bacterium]